MTIQISGSSACHCRVRINCSTMSRSWPAVTAVASSAGPRRTASSNATHEDRPVSRAATKEYGQPGTN
jgi:hypothetical protein